MSANTFHARARHIAPRMLGILKKVAEDKGEKTSDRIAAANTILDRAYGKPVAPTITATVDATAAAALMNLSDEELLQRISASPPAKLAHQPKTLTSTAQLAHQPKAKVQPRRPSNLFDVVPSDVSDVTEPAEIDDLAT